LQQTSSLLRRKTILVVEDDRSTSDLLRDMLEAEGYRCVPASEGHMALQLAREEQPNLITLDLDLPDTDGHSVLHGLKYDEITRDIPIVVVSAFVNKLPANDRAALAGLLPKPVDVAALAGAVRDALAQPAR
jgi:CheY-like chemotaxis protein